ncbi:metallophosphoesterase [Halobellus rufus]|uniref:metallophosphoesterase n=1 Tax=Halobellus rufus TaxID=1448860 RepID=UPI001E588CA6|nr:metallophosphoesterase [Halobellus rufus]
MDDDTALTTAADDIAFRSRSIYLRGADALVLADLHVGRGEASNVTLPVGERRDLTSRLDALLDATRPATTVFAGDVLHRFGPVSERSRETVAALRDCCADAGSDPVFVRGNHDTALDTVCDDVRECYVVGGEPKTVVCHGHEEPPVAADRYVIGHDHPAIEIEGRRRPCALVAPDAHRGADVVMVPAFSRLAPGVEINDARADDLLSPLLDGLDDVRPVVYDDDRAEALAFPPLSSFRRML